MLSLKKLQYLSLPWLSGILLWASWPVSPFTFLIFVAFLPFLWFEDTCNNRLHFFSRTYFMLLIWNAATTWWVCNSTIPGGIAAILANSLLMCIPLLGFYTVKRRLGERAGYIALVVFWLTFEYIHLNWQLSWPWLTLGNVFASHPGWVQWYEYTGTSGGTLWILLINILLFLGIKYRKSPHASDSWYTIAFPALLIVPLFLSYRVKPEGKSTISAEKNIVVVQPNIDPYQKFEMAGQQEQLQLLIRLSETQIDSNTAVVVWPETAINASSGIDEARLNENSFLLPVWDFLARHPRSKLLSGIEGYKMFSTTDKSSTARRIRESDQYIDIYNTAALFNSGGALQLYHKSKLVPGVETLPSFLRFIDTWFEEFGGTTGGYATQQERTVLTDPASGFRLAPAICYESIYGEFLTKYIRNGANIIAIITNDGWWANTSGHKQHMHYARLRAIETRRWVVRSANTGISCFISASGEVFNVQPWDKAAVIKMNIPQRNDLTFYVKYEDLISKTAVVMAVGLLIISTFIFLKKKLKPVNG